MKSEQEQIEKIYLETAIILNNNFMSKSGDIYREYLKNRGIDSKFATNFLVGATDFKNTKFLYEKLINKYDPILLLKSKIINLNKKTASVADYFYPNSIVFPIFEDGKIVSFSARSINNESRLKYKTLKYQKMGIFNIDILKFTKTVYLTEGVIDSMSLNYMGFQSIGILGINSIGIENAEPFMGYRGNIIICLDNDKNGSGQKAIERIGNILDFYNVDNIYYKLLPRDDSLEKMDINTLLTSLGKQKARFLFGKLRKKKFLPTKEIKEKIEFEYDKINEPPLLELVSRHTNLTRCGHYYLGLCPFPNHNDKNPSFVVYENNRFRCYGCGEFGGPHKFIMIMNSIGYKEANLILKETQLV